jgi:hypothetical protein
MKVVRLIQMYLDKPHSEDCTCKHLFYAFPIFNGPKQGDALSPLLQMLYQKVPRKSGVIRIEWDTSDFGLC